MLSILRWWLGNIGISYKWMEENGIMLPVVSLNINYKTSPL
jgi:acyl-CoA thioester hydrolase